MDKREAKKVDKKRERMERVCSRSRVYPPGCRTKRGVLWSPSCPRQCLALRRARDFAQRSMPTLCTGRERVALSLGKDFEWFGMSTGRKENSVLCHRPFFMSDKKVRSPPPFLLAFASRSLSAGETFQTSLSPKKIHSLAKASDKSHDPGVVVQLPHRRVLPPRPSAEVVRSDQLVPDLLVVLLQYLPQARHFIEKKKREKNMAQTT